MPLKIATYAGLLVALGAFVWGLRILLGTLLFGNPVAGYPSLATIMLFLGGVNLMTLGVIGDIRPRVQRDKITPPLFR